MHTKVNFTCMVTQSPVVGLLGSRITGMTTCKCFATRSIAFQYHVLNFK